MFKWLKKLLRIIAIILPAFCVFVSPGVSAKKYSVDSFSAYSYSIYAPNHSSGSDGLVPVNSVPEVWVNDITSIQPRHIPYLVSDFVNSKCDYHLYSNAYYTSANSFSFSRSYLMPDSTFLLTARDTDAFCRSLAPYSSVVGGLITMPDFNYSSVPVNKQVNVSSLVAPDGNVQYNTMYSQFGFTNTRTLQGVEFKDSFYVSDLLNPVINESQETIRRPDSYKYYGSRITRFSFPINFNPALESVNSGSSIVIRGSYALDTEDGDFRSSNSPYVVARFIDYSNYSPTTITQACSVSPVSTYWVDFQCNVNVPITTNMYGFDFVVNGSDNFDNYSTTIIDYANNNDTDLNGITFQTFSITLNGDDTDGGSGSFDNLGSYPNIAPGVPQGEANPDWLSSLLGLFNFTFLNPFNAILGLFTPHTECQHIPIIAGMIHLSNDEICPLYPEPVYYYLTPVFAILSMMVLVSYAMKWLRDDDVYIMGGIK